MLDIARTTTRLRAAVSRLARPVREPADVPVVRRLLQETSSISPKTPPPHITRLGPPRQILHPHTLTEADVAAKYTAAVQETEHTLICNKSQRIVGLLRTLTKDYTQLPYRESDGHRIFKTYWLRTELPPLPSASAPAETVHRYVDDVTTFKYLNLTHRAAKHLRRLVDSPKYRSARSIDVYNGLIDFFAGREDDFVLRSVFRQMELDGIVPNAMTFNLLGKNYLQKSTIVLERLTIWESVLERMSSSEVGADLLSYYVTLGVLPAGIPAKDELFRVMQAHGLDRGVRHFQDIRLNDLLQQGVSAERLLEQYRIAVENGVVDANCMNTVLFKMLDDGASFGKAWNFMIDQFNLLGLRPKNSTLSIFLKHAKRRDDLRLMLVVLNSMYRHFGLVNYNANRMILNYLLKLEDFSLPSWFPLVAKYVLHHHYERSIERHRRLDVLCSQVNYKVNLNFSCDLGGVEELSEEEKRGFRRLEGLVIGEGKVDENDERSESLSELLKEPVKESLRERVF